MEASKGLRGFVSNHSQISCGEPEQEQAWAVSGVLLHAAGSRDKSRLCCNWNRASAVLQEKGGRDGDEAHAGAQEMQSYFSNRHSVSIAFCEFPGLTICL